MITAHNQLGGLSKATQCIAFLNNIWQINPVIIRQQLLKALRAMQAKGRGINHQFGMGKTGMPDGVQHLKCLLFFSRIKTKEKNILIKIQMLKIATV